jgi:hypothetical protein
MRPISCNLNVTRNYARKDYNKEDQDARQSPTAHMIVNLPHSIGPSSTSLVMIRTTILFWFVAQFDVRRQECRLDASSAAATPFGLDPTRSHVSSAPNSSPGSCHRYLLWRGGSCSLEKSLARVCAVCALLRLAWGLTQSDFGSRRWRRRWTDVHKFLISLFRSSLLL